MKRVLVCVAILGLVACRTTNGTKPLNDDGVSNLGGQGTEKVAPNDGPKIPSLVTVYFDYDDSALRVDAKDGLRKNAEYLQTTASAKIELQGNCDERGTEEYNLALGKRRAEAAKQYLQDLGIAPQRLSTVSFGEESPASPGSNESAWAKNRRVDFILR